jgi:hypothetical protein
MTQVRRGTVLSFNPATWTALVLLQGSDVESQMPVGQWIPASQMAVNAEVAVLVFEPESTNTDDAVVLGAYGAVGTLDTLTPSAINVGTSTGSGPGVIRASDKIIPGDTSNSSWIKNYAIAGLGNNAVAALMSDNLSALGIVFVINFNDAALAIYELRGATHTTQEIADPIGVFTNAAGGAASTNIYWSAGNARYEIENKTGGVRTYFILYFGA